ncbi:MAG: nucleotidyltransferase domain-containing protein [Bacteroidales bacterium]|nr:nucleotidyltransferase domain-containing protein [Bacteroidales bacterium]
MLDKTDILNFLRANKEYFKTKFNVIKIGIFGSYARGEQTDNSDIDIIIEFEDNTDNLFDKKFELREFLVLKFNKKIDICREKAIKPIFKPLILKDTIYV